MKTWGRDDADQMLWIALKYLLILFFGSWTYVFLPPALALGLGYKVTIYHYNNSSSTLNIPDANLYTWTGPITVVTDICTACSKLQSTFIYIVTSNQYINSMQQALWYLVYKFGNWGQEWGKRAQSYLSTYYVLGT